MTPGFQQPYPMRWEPWLATPDALPDGRNWRRLDPLIFLCKDGRLFRGIAGGVTDFVSTPREVWALIAPFDYALCGDLHDQAFHDCLELWDAPASTWVKYTMTEQEANNLIDEALESRGCDIIERDTIFKVLQLAGASAFNADRTKPIVPTPVPC